MEVLREIVIDQFGIPVYYPANFEKIIISSDSNNQVAISSKLLHSKQDSSNHIALNTGMNNIKVLIIYEMKLYRSKVLLFKVT